MLPILIIQFAQLNFFLLFFFSFPSKLNLIALNIYINFFIFIRQMVKLSLNIKIDWYIYICRNNMRVTKLWAFFSLQWGSIQYRNFTHLKKKKRIPSQKTWRCILKFILFLPMCYKMLFIQYPSFWTLYTLRKI